MNDSSASQNYQMKVFMEILVDSICMDNSLKFDLLLSLSIKKEALASFLNIQLLLDLFIRRNIFFHII